MWDDINASSVLVGNLCHMVWQQSTMQGGIDKKIRAIDGWNEAAMDPWLMDTLDQQAQLSRSLIK